MPEAKGGGRVKWVCGICGYEVEGEAPPEECAVCGADSEAFNAKES